QRGAGMEQRIRYQRHARRSWVVRRRPPQSCSFGNNRPKIAAHSPHRRRCSISTSSGEPRGNPIWSAVLDHMQHLVGGALRSIDPISYCVGLALLVLVYAAWRASAGDRICVSDRVYRSLLLAASVAGSLGSIVVLGT